MTPLFVRGGSGLGDSIYIQSLTRHLAAQDSRRDVVALSDWPDVFRFTPGVRVEPFQRIGGNILVAHYAPRKGHQETTQWYDTIFAAGLRGEIPLHMDWVTSDRNLTDQIRDMSAGKPLVAVQLPRAPMGRTDGFGADLLPTAAGLQSMIDALTGRAFLVLVGKGRPVHRLHGIDLDLTNQTSIPQLIDVYKEVDACAGYPSFMIPLAESLGKPGLYVWAHSGLTSESVWSRRVTPRKVIHYKNLGQAIVDNSPESKFQEEADALLERARSPRPV